MAVHIYPPATGVAKEELVRIKILRQTTALRRVVRPNEVISVSTADARLLVGSGKAEFFRGADRDLATAPPLDPSAQPKSRRSRRGKV